MDYKLHGPCKYPTNYSKKNRVIIRKLTYTLSGICHFSKDKTTTLMIRPSSCSLEEKTRLLKSSKYYQCKPIKSNQSISSQQKL